MSTAQTTLPPRPTPGSIEAALRLLGEAVDALAVAVPTQARTGELGDQLVALQAGLDALGGVASRWSDVFEQAGGPEEAGSPTLAAWMRQQLRLTGRDARKRVDAGRALQRLPRVREALQAGEIGSGHLDAIASGVKTLGSEVIGAFEDIVLQVARDCDADAVKQTIRTIRDTLDPDAADAAYLHALDKRDITLTRVGEGFAVGGFLDPETGVMFQQVLYSAAKPTDKNDLRAPHERRVDGLRDLCRSFLDHGLPTDRGVRPQLFVTVTADRLTGVGDDQTPAVLTGFGQISDLLLSKLACDCAVTPVKITSSGPYPHVLDVGRTSRLATLKQRQAILTQQGGSCYAPGCTNTHLEIHHLVPWAGGGRTDMANQRGYCSRCHHLIHLGHLIVTPDGKGGWSHRTRHGRRLTDHTRTATRLTHRYLHALLEGGAASAHAELDRWRRGDLQPRVPIPEPAVDRPAVDRRPVDRRPVDRPPDNRPPVDGRPVDRPPVKGRPVDRPLDNGRPVEPTARGPAT